MSYSRLIEETRLFRSVDTSLTTGDMEYEGTALEVRDDQLGDLFHIVVDEAGEQQILFFKTEYEYRIPLQLFESIIRNARLQVKQL